MNQTEQAIFNTVLKLQPRPSTLLDIGCGVASFTATIASALPQTAVTGLDPVHPRRPVPASIRFVRGNVEDLPFNEESFDVLTASKSLHHWSNKKKGLAESYRVLKRGGWLVVGDALIQGWLENRFMGWLVKHLDSGTISPYGELVVQLEEVGFEAISITMIPKSMKSLFLIQAQKP